MKVVVLGAGMAGLGVAHALAAVGVRQLHVLDPAPLPFSHASGRNAAIYRPLELHPGLAALAWANGSALDALVGSRGGWLRRCGLVLTGDDEAALEAQAVHARAQGAAVVHWQRDELIHNLAVLDGTAARRGLCCEDGGVMDVHAVLTALWSGLTAAGANLRLGCGAQALTCQGGRVTGVVTQDGHRLEADAVVVAAGAWSHTAAVQAGLGLPVLTPRRRHLVMLEGQSPLSAAHPVVWDIARECYFRSEGRGVLASPGDTEATDPGNESAHADAPAWLAEKLESVAPVLTPLAVARMWACQRTFAPDHLPVVGPDDRAPGLWWLTALGGFGMSTGVALAAQMAQWMVHGTATMDLVPFSPQRAALARLGAPSSNQPAAPTR